VSSRQETVRPPSGARGRCAGRYQARWARISASTAASVKKIAADRRRIEDAAALPLPAMITYIIKRLDEDYGAMQGVTDDDLDDLAAHRHADLLTGAVGRLGGEIGRWATRLNGRPQVSDHTVFQHAP
jgi:hypothetical protein